MRFLLFFMFYLFAQQTESLESFDRRSSHIIPEELSDGEFRHAAGLTDDAYFHKVLQHILIPRVVGTSGHLAVEYFIKKELANLRYDLELDTFREKTPNLGVLKFTNIIGHKNINAPQRLVLACHYDSKYFKHINFMAATDSAVPCAMLIHLAKVLDPYIAKAKIGLSLIFFDGEEAFYSWSPQDSLYGARSLARKWAATGYLPKIDLFVLLDLIGTKEMKFMSHFRNTDSYHSVLSRIEKRLKTLGLSPTNTYSILDRSTSQSVEDDHIPFLERNVPILHLIPINYPKVWHTVKDDYSALDFPAIKNMNKIMQVFVYAYLRGASKNS